MKNRTKIVFLSISLAFVCIWLFHSSIGRPSNWSILMMEWDYRNGDQTNALRLAGYHYDNGNFERAKQINLEMAENGHLGAMGNVVAIYLDERAGTDDVVEARKWAERAKAAGHKYAEDHFKEIEAYERRKAGPHNSNQDK